MASNEIAVKTGSDQTLLAAQTNAGAIIVDRGRRRPFYFDGRFLTANDLIADQDYIRARQSDLAQMAGTSRESVSRFLATLERAGVVQVGRGRVTVIEPERLDAYIF